MEVKVMGFVMEIHYYYTYYDLGHCHSPLPIISSYSISSYASSSSRFQMLSNVEDVLREHAHGLGN